MCPWCDLSTHSQRTPSLSVACTSLLRPPRLCPEMPCPKASDDDSLVPGLYEVLALAVACKHTLSCIHTGASVCLVL